MPTSQVQLDALLAAVSQESSLIILPHNDPDPDAIAGALALRFLLKQILGLKCYIFYKGIIGRAENRALVQYLGHPLQRMVGLHLDEESGVALIDTQPGTGNNALLSHIKPKLVIDHHPLRNEVIEADFVDVRPNVGSSATILTEYIQLAGLEPDAQLATALFYGIKTDTMGLGRNISPADVAAYFFLQPRVDIESLVKIERAQVPADYFKNFDATLRAARVFKDTVISYIGTMVYPDLAAEMADLLLRLKGTHWVICMGVHGGALVLAVRTRKRDGAGELVQSIVGQRGSAGGHGHMAGGYVPLREDDPEELALQFKQRALQFLYNSPGISGEPLV